MVSRRQVGIEVTQKYGIDFAGRCREADTLVWQNALSQLSHLYMMVLNYEEELSMALQAAELAKASLAASGRPRGVSKNLGFHLVEVASAYRQLNDTLHCLQYLDEAYRIILVYYRDREREQAILQRNRQIMLTSVIAVLTLLCIMLGVAVLYKHRKKKFDEEIDGKEKLLLRTICLMKIGMRPAQIVQVMDARKQTVWNRVKRARDTCGNLLDEVRASE